MIETERVLLRPFECEDAEAVFALSADSRVTRYTGDGDRVKTLEDASEIIAKVFFQDYATYGYGRWAVVWKETGQVIGFCGLKYLPEMKQTDFGYRFIPEFWGKGIATESGRAMLDYASKHWDTGPVVAMTDPENDASHRVLLKLGFEQDGMVEYWGEQVRFYKQGNS
ncbi:GNAT family N-acetyltransferase [Ferrimonas sp.]|uniref:GNAT family N-acetyltransferase n=1 Tax=Ferrimonas sp. TaxID=2080861 RepID=UPI003A955C2A